MVRPALSQAPAVTPTPDERKRMAGLAATFMNAYDVPGLSIAVAVKGKPAYVEAFGVADRETGEALTPQHRFRIASISKPVTSVGIFTLIEAGKLRLGDYVVGSDSSLGGDYPAVPNLLKLMAADPPRSPNELVTIEHLLTHTTGGWGNRFRDPMFMNKDMTHRQLIAWTLEQMRLTAPPGETYAYSNFGYCVLGRVIEKLTGQTYEQYIKEKRPEALRHRRHADRREYAKGSGGQRGQILQPERWRSLRHERRAYGFARRLDRDGERFDQFLRSYRQLQGHRATSRRRYAAHHEHAVRCKPSLCQGLLPQFGQLVAQRPAGWNDNDFRANARRFLLVGIHQHPLES
jgi:CubicO group peptidase (beta-lactamase class C family)